jgi:Flp pilus assembly protein TadD
MSAHALFDVQNLFQDALRHHLAGRIEDAVSRYKRTLYFRPDYADAHNNLGVALAAQGRFDEAIMRYRRALLLQPASADAHVNLGAALAAQGRFIDGITHYRHALALNPAHSGAHYNLAIALEARGHSEEAVTHYRRAIALHPANADAHNNLGNALAAKGDRLAAVNHYTSAISVNPGHAEAHNNLANMLREEGRFDEALAHYDRAIESCPTHAQAHFHRAELKADLAALQALASRKDLPAKDVPFIHFGLAKALEDRGDYKRAFAHLRLGNESKRKQIHYDEASAIRRFEEIAAAFDRSLFDRFQGSGDPSAVPVFVVGMPRSGSTLVEQILASHPQIHGAGELTYPEFPESIASLDGPALRRLAECYLSRLPKVAHSRIVDKLPENFLRIGLIRLILPNAKIIHTVRNPLGACLSCYSTLFASGQHFSYDLAELGRYYSRYAALMSHWRSVLPAEAILDVSYENVVGDLESQARRLIEYCGVPWSAGGATKTISPL